MTQRRSDSTASSHSRRSKRPAYVVTPGGSVTALLGNLPYLVNASAEQPPVFLMDSLDYNRLQTWGTKGIGGSKIQTLLLAYDWLHRRGIVRFIDYSDFYLQSTQQNTLRQNRAVVEDLPDSIQQRIAVQAANAWVDYGRGAHLEVVCESLGEDGERFRAAQRTDKKRRHKLERGLSAPRKWNERVLNRYLAALHVRQYADDILDLDVRGVIGQGESAGIGSLLAAAEMHASTNASHIRNLDPTTYLYEYPSERVAPTRELFDTISELATEIAGVQHEDWIMIGPSLAIPQYHDVFDMDVIREQVQNGIDTDSLADEATRVMATLQRRADDGSTPHRLSYETDWLVEQQSSLWAGEGTQSTGLTKMADYAVNLSQYSAELRTLVKRGDVSQTAALVGASIVNDPSSRDDPTAIHRRGEDIIARLDPPLVDEKHLKAARRRVVAWDEHPDWYENTNRVR